jgi:hypothetical protein
LPWFSSVKLGPHQERLRQLLETEDADEPWKYGCLSYRITHADPSVASGFVAGPLEGKFEGGRLCGFPISGMLWMFYIAGHPPPPAVEEGLLQKDGTMHVLQMSFEDVAMKYWPPGPGNAPRSQ